MSADNSNIVGNRNLNGIPVSGKTRVKKAGKRIVKKTDTQDSSAAPAIVPSAVPPALLEDLLALIESARVRVAVGVNAELVMLHWHVGYRLRADILHSGRKVYGEKIIELVARDLTGAYGRGFSEKSLRHMMRFAEAFPDETIVSTLSRQLSWSHFLDLIYIDDPLKREFYTEGGVRMRGYRRGGWKMPTGDCLGFRAGSFRAL